MLVTRSKLFCITMAIWRTGPSQMLLSSLRRPKFEHVSTNHTQFLTQEKWWGEEILILNVWVNFWLKKSCSRYLTALTCLHLRASVFVLKCSAYIFLNTYSLRTCRRYSVISVCTVEPFNAFVLEFLIGQFLPKKIIRKTLLMYENKFNPATAEFPSDWLIFLNSWFSFNLVNSSNRRVFSKLVQSCNEELSYSLRKNSGIKKKVDGCPWQEWS